MLKLDSRKDPTKYDLGYVEHHFTKNITYSADMDACTTSQLTVTLVRKLLCAWFIFDMLSISFCTTRHWQTSGQLVQELNVCTVVNDGLKYSRM